MLPDTWKGGVIELAAVANKTYPIISNDASGVITVAADQTMSTDHAGDANLGYYLTLDNEAKAVSAVIGDGEENPGTEFSLSIYIDGAFWKKYGDLSTNPTSGRYWVNIINNDEDNFAVEAVDTWTGAHTAAVRPANYYGKIATVTTTVLTAEIADFTINSPGGGDPTFALGTTDDNMLPQKITITMSDATTGEAASDRFGDLGTVTLGSLFTPNGGTEDIKWCPPFTITAGASPLVATDTLVINYKPFLKDKLIGGYVYPDKPNAKLTKFRIVDNDHKTITAADGSDLTADGATDDYFLVEYEQELAKGMDGNAGVGDTQYTQQAWDVVNSPFNRIVGRNMGMIKFATPGVTATAVQKAGDAYAAAKNGQYRKEVASNIVTENGAITAINDTIGRSDFSVCAFPSFGYVSDPVGGTEGKRKLISLTGMIHGREARIAADYNGYHKAQAGNDAILPAILDLPTGEAALDHEILNPVGIQLIQKRSGNYVIWGDRNLNIDPTWKWKHQREQMSWYEHIMLENYDWIIFAINDPDQWDLANASLQSLFLPEWRPKRALRGDKFSEACIIKVDAENNTEATGDAGDMHAKVSLKLANTVERFIITVNKQGIFEQTG
jgi:hypothetical protein